MTDTILQLFQKYDIVQYLLYLFFVAASIQIFYYIFFYSRVFWFKKNDIANKTVQEPVSIIIAAHNEAENLQNFLPSILEQNYPKYEIIVINDRSVDNTDTIIAQFKEKYPHLRSSFISVNSKITYGKKLAVTIGIKAAKYDNILLTDADCKPISENWIQTMVQYFETKDIILGYGPYFEKKSFINKLIRFDTLFIALQYFSFSKAGIPYMGVGRNLAYKKKVFVKNNGLASHSHIRSGDDDLFISEVSNADNTTISINPESFVYSEPKDSFKDWAIQKSRHFTTFKHYKISHKILLTSEVLSRVVFYILFFGLLFSQYNNYLFIGIASIRFTLFTSTLIYSTYLFKEKKISFLIILFDFISPFLNLFVHLVYSK